MFENNFKSFDMKILTKKILLSISLMGIYLSGSLAMIYILNINPNIVLIISLLTILLLFVFQKKHFLKIDLLNFTLIFLFFVARLISSILNNSISSVISSITIFTTYIVLAIIVPTLTERLEMDTSKTTINLFLITFVPLILYSLKKIPIRLNRYTGVFYNPNGFAIVSSTIFIVFFSLLSYDLLLFICDEKKRISIVNLISSVFFYFLIIASSSRNSFVAASIIVFLYFFLLVIYVIKNFQDKKVNLVRFSYIIIGLIFLLTIFSLSSFGNKLFSSLIEKFVYKSTDLLDGRGYIWKTTVNDYKLFGNGRDYFNSFIFGAHNTFIGILGQYGFIPMIFFLLYLVKRFFSSLINLYNIKNNKFIIFYSIILFLLLSTAESMMGHTLMYLLFVTEGYYN